MMAKHGNNFEDLTGKRFGRLTVIEEVGRNKHGQTLWKCKCDCGKEKITYTNALNMGRIRSCGCLKAEGNNYRHGLCYSRINKIYRNIKRRCLSKNDPRYESYGGRGITICEEWLGREGFINFYNWSLKNGYSDELTIDRIDNNGNYCPENCRWTDQFTQSNNTRSNHYIQIDGVTHTLAEWCRIKNLNYSKVEQRIRVLKWPDKEALEIEKHG